MLCDHKEITKIIYLEIYYEELAHRIMGVEKPQDLQCATWGPRKVGVILFVSKDLRIRNSDGVSSCPSTREEIRLAPSVKKGEKKNAERNFSFLCLLFFPGPQPVG